MTTITKNAMTLEEKLEKIQESLLALCNTSNHRRRPAETCSGTEVPGCQSGQPLQYCANIYQQTRTHNVAILRLENSKHPPCNSSTGKDPTILQPAIAPTHKHGGRQATALLNMEFPTYGGVVDPLSALNHCSLFFGAQRTLEAKKVGNLASPPSIWWMTTSCGMTSTRMFTALCRGKSLPSWLTPNLAHFPTAKPPVSSSPSSTWGMIADFNKQFNHFYGWHSVRSLKVNVQWLF
jgi:hypothetical protein